MLVDELKDSFIKVGIIIIFGSIKVGIVFDLKLIVVSYFDYY